MKGDLTVRLYPKDVALTTLEADITADVFNLRFTTQLNGGYGECTFHYAGGSDKAWQWYDRFARWKRVQVREPAWEVNGLGYRPAYVWEGQVEDVELILGGVNVTALGYWATAWYDPHMDLAAAPPAPYTYNANETAEDIIKDVLTRSCPLIAADQTHVDDPGLVIATAADPLSWGDTYPGDIVLEIARHGDAANDHRWWFAVWEDRIPWFKEEAVSAVTWNARLSDFAPMGFSLRKGPRDFASQVYALYLAAGVLTRTNLASDADVEGDQRQKTYVVSNLGEVDSGVATQRRDTELAWRKSIHPQGRFTLDGLVYDAYWNPRPLWRVRAGDVIRIADLVPDSAGLSAVTLDRLRTFFVRRTQYDFDHHTLTIDPDVLTPSLAMQLVKEGLGK